MVFQKPTPFPMTIFDNIAFGIDLYEKLSRSEMEGRVESALRRAALWRRSRTSSGQRNVALGRATTETVHRALGRDQAGSDIAG